MKSALFGAGVAAAVVAPVRERGLKCNGKNKNTKKIRVAPVRERGLKFYELQYPTAKR